MSDDYAGPGVPTFGPPVGMCPHCGEDVVIRSGLTATHDWPKFTRQVCPGSQQNARNAESDGRPLWNGKPNPRYYRNSADESGRSGGSNV